jgi:hypothetical protein
VIDGVHEGLDLTGVTILCGTDLAPLSVSTLPPKEKTTLRYRMERLGIK